MEGNAGEIVRSNRVAENTWRDEERHKPRSWHHPNEATEILALLLIWIVFTPIIGIAVFCLGKIFGWW